ncbi:MAG: hypothetical protein ABI876_02865, partial [Bacteroidota bacterium]
YSATFDLSDGVGSVGSGTFSDVLVMAWDIKVGIHKRDVGADGIYMISKGLHHSTSDWRFLYSVAETTRHEPGVIVLDGNALHAVFLYLRRGLWT